MVQPLHSSLFDHETHLAALGLKLEYFYDAIRGGEHARRLITKNDPRSAAGTDDYYKRVRVLRERLIKEEGWSRGELDGSPLVVNPDATLAIGVLLGDHQTGWQGNYHPRSKRPVGGTKVALIAQNGQQGVLFRRPLVTGEVDLESEDLAKLRTWFFVTYRRPTKDGVIVSSELSEPSSVNPTGYVDKWNSRIPFPDLPFKGVTPSDDDNTVSYDVEVDEK